MRIKKSIAFLLSLMMILSIVGPLSVVAETSSVAPIITVQSLADTAGATIDVNVVIENNPGILGATFQVDYGDGLTLVSATNGDAFSKLTMTPSASLTSPCKFVWDGQEITSENTKDGIILTLRFKISEEAEVGDNYEVNISYKSGNVFDANLDTIDVDINNGYVSVISYMPGDLDGNKDINSRDIILLRRHVAGGYEQEINEAAADVDNSTEANSRDIILIRRYVAGGYGVELMPSSPKCEHSLTKKDFVDATCTLDGNIAYWHCNLCNKYFADENAVTLVKIDDTIIKAEGHDIVIDEAVEPTYKSTGLTEGKHCSVCNEIIVAQTVLPKLEKNEYSITYHIHNNDNYLESIDIENPNPATYAQEEGIVLQDLMVRGYNFVGWFTAQTGGTQVTEIVSGTTGNKTLYAHWEKVVYTVQFESTMVPQTGFTYTAGQEKTLPKPVLDKYTFAGWTDKEGNLWTSIPVGTAQDLILYANWSSNRNRAVAVKNLADPIICEDSENGLILFTYEIGEMQNVPLFTILNLNCANGIITTSSRTETEEISNTNAMAVAKTVSKATTNSSTWTLSSDWNNTTEISESYLNQTGQTREEAETLSKTESGSYNLTTTNGDNTKTVTVEGEVVRTTNNDSGSTTDTTERTKGVDLSVDAKYSNETNVGAKASIELVDLNVSNKSSFEIGVGANYNQAETKTNAGTTGWFDTTEILEDNSTTTTSDKIWNQTSAYTESQSTSTNTSVSNAISSLISKQYGYGSSYSEGGSNSQAKAIESNDAQSDEYSSTLTYYTSKIVSTTTSYESSGHTNGGYRLVRAGTVHVFAVVGYNVAEKTYFVYTYNVLDDETEEYLDYSFDGTFKDYETSVIPFEVPYFVNEYVNNRIAKTAGLTIDPDTGIIEEYTPNPEKPDNIVVIPSYMSIDNEDGTYKSVKVKGIAPGLFKNNANIKGIKLSEFMTEIPNSAFEGCSALRYIYAPSVTRIGNNAFKGCISLEKFEIPAEITSVGTNAFGDVSNITAVASNKSVAQAVAVSGAENIVLDISSATDMNDAEIEVGNIRSFELQGKDKEYSGLSVKSNAQTTVINGVKFVDCEKTTMEISSENITLNRVTANTSGLALVMTADNADVKLNQTVSLSASLGNAVLCKNASFSSLNTGVVGKMVLDGDMLVAGTITGENKLTFTNGEIKYITDDEFENYRTSCTVTFDANGGTVDATSKAVAFNTAIGELPEATYCDYTLLGWYTSDGTKLTTDTIVDSNITVYAKWNNWDGTSSEPAYNEDTMTYTITNGSELAWISDVTNGVINSGANLPTDTSFNNYTIELANDIFLNDTSDYESWDRSSNPENTWRSIAGFNGIFDGQNYSIYGLYKYSLFDEINENVELRNTSISSGYIYLSYGGFANINSGLITNCINESVTISISYDENGGIVGTNSGEIEGCGNKAYIEGKCVGGIVGKVENGLVSNCWNIGILTAIGWDGNTVRAGGIVGLINDGEVSNCWNKGDVNIEGATDEDYRTLTGYAGGIAGATKSKTGTIIIENCYNNGDVNGRDCTGGIIGEAEGVRKISIENCHNRGTISGYYPGGIVGGLMPSEKGYIKKCYNVGTISSVGGIDHKGGLASYIRNTYVNFSYSNYDPVIYEVGDLCTWTDDVSYKSSSDIKELSNLAGFNTSVWATDPDINDGYPYLIELEDTY